MRSSDLQLLERIDSFGNPQKESLFVKAFGGAFESSSAIRRREREEIGIGRWEVFVDLMGNVLVTSFENVE